MSEANSNLPEGVTYGITLCQMEDDKPSATVIGDPDVGQLQRLLSAALANLQADIVAEKVVHKLNEQARKPHIHVPGGG